MTDGEMVEAIRDYLRRSGWVAQSVAAVEPDLPRWVKRLRARGVTAIPRLGVLGWSPAASRAHNELNLLMRQASLVRDAELEHRLRKSDRRPAVQGLSGGCLRSRRTSASDSIRIRAAMPSLATGFGVVARRRRGPRRAGLAQCSRAPCPAQEPRGAAREGARRPAGVAHPRCDGRFADSRDRGRVPARACSHDQPSDEPISVIGAGCFGGASHGEAGCRAGAGRNREGCLSDGRRCQTSLGCSGCSRRPRQRSGVAAIAAAVDAQTDGARRRSAVSPEIRSRHLNSAASDS